MIPREGGDSRWDVSVPEVTFAGIQSRAGGLVFYAGVGVVLGMMLAGTPRNGIRDVCVPGIWVAAALALMAEMGRHQPMQYVLTAAGIAGGAGMLMSTWTPEDGLPMWGATALWVTAMVGARGTARWILRRGAGGAWFGLRVLALSNVIAAVVIELAGGDLSWHPRVPTFLLTLMVAGVVQLLATPWFLEKRTLLPVIRSGPAGFLGWAMVSAMAVRILLAK